MPLARIYTDDLNEILTTKLQLHAAEAGVGLIPSKPTNSINHLSVSVDDVSLNGFDILFIRYPKANIELTGTLKLATGASKMCKASGASSQLSKFAFSSDLNYALVLAIDSAAHDLLHCLGLVDKIGASTL
jgi:hypothetical protein